nr:MAG TPA: hypothetical protein [Caudoviricetes sp.]
MEKSNNISNQGGWHVSRCFSSDDRYACKYTCRA